jgi:LysM repeat protein
MKLKLIAIFSVMYLAILAQSPSELYIEKWYKVAQAEMQAYGIPASITLAQGILESANGRSKLATEGNNHFGIKCHLEWEGKKIYADDDEKGECFRSYNNAEESFRDHSLFLSTRTRYAFLFEESPTDYKAWAKGLKKAGYATNKKYADLLIDLIERYELHRFDKINAAIKDLPPLAGEAAAFADEHLVKLSSNKVKYIVARSGDSFESIAQFADCKAEDLLDYNDLRYDATVKDGQIIYLQPKRRRASREHRFHLVQEGEDMYAISQKFGVRLEKLYQRNDLNVGEQPKVGTRLELR